MNRRTKCELIGKRALLLNNRQAVRVWKMLAERLYNQGDPGRVGTLRFNDILQMVRRSTIDDHHPEIHRG